MTSFDDATLVAYVDGELDADAAAAVERAMNADAGLGRMIQSLRADTDLVRAAFEPMLHHRLPPLRVEDDRIRAMPPAVQRPRGRGSAPRRAAWQIALAAGLAGILFGGSMVHLAAPRSDSTVQAHRQFKTDRQVEMAALINLLENQLSGTTANWHNEDTGNGGTITVVRTFQTAQGQYCREFTATSTLDDIPATVTGIACREDQAQWRTRRSVFES